ncbi:MAG: hypothetical protein ACT6TH_04890 [Brevundimonas sp.]|jgi:hypothetical protein|uniref:hypothetical protein n=1 Tax=Brevundimonas sp. TaxID=1871086 RepID=UPI004034CD90
MKVGDKPDDRATWGVLAGAGIGGATVSVFLTAVYAFSYPVPGGTFRPAITDIIGWGAVSFVAAAIVYIFGLLLVGVPGWILLHWLKFRGPRTAALWGATATAMVTASWTFTSGGPFNFGVGQALLALNGALVGFVIQRIAYRVRPPRPSPAPPCEAPRP